VLDLWGEGTMSDYDDYMADVEQALRGVYSGAEGVLRAYGLRMKRGS
jgi:hypothetical protein